MKQKVALFDIDNTLSRGDSLIPFYLFGLKRFPPSALLLPVMPFAGLLCLLKILPVEKFKSLFYTAISRFHETDFEEFFDRFIYGRRIETTWNALLRHQTEGYCVLLCTASPYAYMRIFEQRGLCRKVLGSPLKEKKGRYTAQADGKNCAGPEKLRRIEEYLIRQGIEIDAENSVGYGDSDKDRFMLSLVDTRIRVQKSGAHAPYTYP